MSLGRTIRLGKQFAFVELDLAAIGKAVDDTIETNLLVWSRCLSRARQHLEANKDADRGVSDVRLAELLFEASALKSYVQIATELCRKIHIMKEER